jgi:GAF domain-containing protein
MSSSADRVDSSAAGLAKKRPRGDQVFASRPRKPTCWIEPFRIGIAVRDNPTRIAQLRRLMVLDSPRERAYDDFAQSLATNLDVPIALINMLDVDRDWFKACIGLPMTESAAATSFCQAFFATSADLIVVEDTLTDERFAKHPFVVGAPFIRFYAGARLAVNGETVGTLCAYDIRPKKLSVDQLDHMRALAESAIELLQARDTFPSDSKD